MNEEKKKVFGSLVFPFVFLVLIWLVKFCEMVFHWDFSDYGLFPLKISGLIGIVTAPLIHANFSHLLANSAPLFFLSWGIFYFYKEVAFKVFILIYIISGFWIWLFARDAFHIGASGLIYGFSSFLFLSGLIRREGKLMAISMLIIFLYGGMVWGIFPLKEQVSWESHLMGLLAGILIAWFYRKEGPQKKTYQWNEEEDEKYPVLYSEDDPPSSQTEEDVKTP
jgi:membrane associated rhomboid family serine protease